jgi:hypothetical protein
VLAGVLAGLLAGFVVLLRWWFFLFLFFPSGFGLLHLVGGMVFVKVFIFFPVMGF